MAAAHKIGGLQKGKTRRPDLAAVRSISTIGDQIDPKLALWCFDSLIYLARRHVITLGIQFEMVDQRLHRALHFAAAWWRHLAIVDFDRSLRHRGDRLLD